MFKNIDKNNLHHACLIEGEREEVLPLVINFIESSGIKTTGNPDFSHIQIDTLRIEDARNIKSLSSEKSVSGGKRVFLITANNFLLEAQNSMLKIFEEPVPGTHFFLVVPDKNILLKTLASRFHVVSHNGAEKKEKDAEKFIAMPITKRIDFLKELLAEPEDEEDAMIDSARSKALKFLNDLEETLHKSLVSKSLFDTGVFEHIFKVRKYLRMPGSSAKNLMEYLALTLPK